MKQKQLTSKLRQLLKAPALGTDDEYAALHDRLRPAFTSAGQCATFALRPGAEAVAHFHLHPDQIPAFGESIRLAREAAIVLRRIAALFEAGASRAEVAIAAINEEKSRRE